MLEFMSFCNKAKSWLAGHTTRIVVLVLICPGVVSFFGLEAVPGEPNGWSNFTTAFKEKFVTWGLFVDWLRFALPALACYFWYHGMPEAKLVAEEKSHELSRQGVFKIMAPICTMAGVIVQTHLFEGVIMFIIFSIYIIYDVCKGKCK